MPLTQSDLDQFIGTETYHRAFPRFFLTDGAKFLAEKAGAWWFVADLIWSHQKNVGRNAIRQGTSNEFQVWTLKKNKTTAGAKAECDDGNGKRLAVQRIEWTDFPLDEVKLYVQRSWSESQGYFLVVMLPSEY